MYYITEKSSETGKKFQVIEEKRSLTFDEQKRLADKYGFKAWRAGHWVVFGGFSSCVFETVPDLKVWKKTKEVMEFMPKLNNKLGRQIQDEFNEMPIVSKQELNQCVGFEEKLFSNIGFAVNNDKYYGISVEEKWGIKMPADCKEVTVSEYREYFKK